MRNARGFTVLETLIGGAVLASLAAVAIQGLGGMSRQSDRAGAILHQTQEALTLLETLRLELSSMVMNPLPEPANHRGNSLEITDDGRRLQFVAEHRQRGRVERFLVAWGAEGPDGLRTLARHANAFLFRANWYTPAGRGGSWPQAWVGPTIPEMSKRFDAVPLADVRFDYLVPRELESRVYLRVKLVVRAAGGRLVPMSTLVSLPTPDPRDDVSECPCLFSPGFDPAHPDCEACLGGDQ